MPRSGKPGSGSAVGAADAVTGVAETGGLAPYVAAKLVVHFNAHVPFLLGTATVLAAAVTLSTVHRALDAADRGQVAQPETNELDRAEREEELQVGAGLGSAG